MYEKDNFQPTYGFREADLFKNKPFMLPQQPIKLSNSDKNLVKCGEPFQKHFSKK